MELQYSMLKCDMVQWAIIVVKDLLLPFCFVVFWNKQALLLYIIPSQGL